MSYYEPDDDYMSVDSAIDAGWWTPDDVDEVRALLELVEFKTPTPGDRSTAALILIDHKVNPPAIDPKTRNAPPEDPLVLWAKVLLDLNRSVGAPAPR